MNTRRTMLSRATGVVAACALALAVGPGCRRRAPSGVDARPDLSLPEDAPGRARRVRIPELSLRVVEVGDVRARETRVIVHGGPGLDHTYLRPWLDALAEPGVRLLYVDLRGHGRSDPPPDASGYGLAAAAMDLASLIERECEGRAADVVAHDAGAAVALTLALNHPERVARMVLVAPLRDGAQLRGVTERTRAALGDASYRQLRALSTPQGTLRDARALPELLRLLSPAWFARPPSRAVLDRLGRDALYREEADAHFLVALSRWDARTIAPDVRALTLVISGADDRTLPAVDARGLAAVLPHGQYAEVPAAGHLPFVEQRDAFLRSVRGFLRGPAAR